MEETKEGLALALATREEIKTRKRKLEEKVRCSSADVCGPNCWSNRSPVLYAYIQCIRDINEMMLTLELIS